jgi:phosphatidylserine/phosphatidylglycerophosphate/cardiolipin synthase-like enzyme
MSKRRKTRRGGQSSGTILIALLALVLIYLYQSGTLGRWLEEVEAPEIQVGPQSPAPGGQTPEPGATTGSGEIQVFFTTPSLVYPDRPAQRGDSPLLQAVMADIDAARTSVDVAVFDLDVVQFVDTLIRAKERGVAVRAIVDSENLETPEVAEQTGRLQDADIPVTFDDREPFMHNKFVVVDGAVAWTGSWNITTNDTFRNNNNMLRFASSEMAANYAREFDQMFDGTFGTRKSTGTPHPRLQIGGVPVEVYFSPEDRPAQYVLQRLEQATTSIRFMTFSFTSDPIAQAMIAKTEAGLTVQGVFERQNASGSGAEFQTLSAGGVDVLEDGNCYIMHHKVIVIDDRIVITGSYNFTASAERDNDENLVIIEDPTLARAYLDEFERLYEQAQSPTRCG